MPAIRPSQAAARRAATVLREATKEGATSRVTRKVADKMFMPAWSHATASVPVPPSCNNKRNFSSDGEQAKNQKNKSVQGARLSRGSADRMFMPTWSSATATVQIIRPALNNVVSEPRRNFSSVLSHEHDMVREEWKTNGVIDYWTAHSSEHVTNNNSTTKKSADEGSGLIDYWKDHRDSHFVDVSENPVLHHQNLGGSAKVHRCYSTDSGNTALSLVMQNAVKRGPVKMGECAPLVDYWTNHNDTHFTDYWEEHSNAHV